MSFVPTSFHGCNRAACSSSEANADIKGIQHSGLEHKVLLYSDEMLLYILQPLSSLPNLMVLLTELGKISGYKVNIQKSELMPVGTGVGRMPLVSAPFKSSPKKFKGLHITIKIYKQLTISLYYPI